MSSGHLFRVKDPATQQPLTMPHMKAELGIVLGAGFETTSHAITWTLAALATHPSVQVSRCLHRFCVATGWFASSLFGHRQQMCRQYLLPAIHVLTRSLAKPAAVLCVVTTRQAGIVVILNMQRTVLHKHHTPDAVDAGQASKRAVGRWFDHTQV
jgi:hypothetical protein